MRVQCGQHNPVDRRRWRHEINFVILSTCVLQVRRISFLDPSSQKTLLRMTTREIKGKFFMEYLYVVCKFSVILSTCVLQARRISFLDPSSQKTLLRITTREINLHIALHRHSEVAERPKNLDPSPLLERSSRLRMT